MLTSEDINLIGDLLDEKLDKKLAPLTKDIKVVKKDIKSLKKKTDTISGDIKVIIDYFDRRDIKVNKRLTRLEKLSSLPAID